MTACGASKNSANSGKAGAVPTVRITRLTPEPSDGGNPAASRPGGTAGPGFMLASPTPVPTCAPADLLRQVDKQRALPADYLPPDLVQLQPKDSSPGAVLALKLRREAEDKLRQMLEQARSQNIYLLAQSTYRSYDEQSRLYAAEVSNYGQARADRESARPGHSEHQLGLAVDFTTRSLNYDLNESFAATAEGRWLTQNATQFGFVLSYPQDKENVTGYMYEPWHYRYVGIAPAQEFLKSGLTLREWLAPRQVGCGA